MKKNPFQLCVVCVVLCILSVRAFAADGLLSPEATVTTFYKWFMEHDSDQTYPLREPAIFTYVEEKTVEKLRKQYSTTGAPQDVDYFLKVQDYDAKVWANHIDSHPAVLLGDQAVSSFLLAQSPK